MKAVIVVDAQNDFITDALRNEDAIAALPNVKKVVDWAVTNGYDLIFTQDTHTKNYLNTQEGKNLPVPHCIMGTPGWQVANAVLPDKDYPFKTVQKPTFGFLYWPDGLADYEEIILCGFCTDICVVSNALILKAEFPEVKVSVVENACAGTTPDNHAAAIATMKSCQVNVMEDCQV